MPTIRHKRRQPPSASVQAVPWRAPMGGVNTVDSALAMPPGDCVYAWNVIPSERGLRTRLGWREWCTTLTGAADNRVSTIVPFRGGRKSGSTDKLFATTSSGIWDVTSSSAAPSRSVDFPLTGGDAGVGIECIMATLAGRFLFLADEENGLYRYTESSASWEKMAAGVAAVWATNTSVAVGTRVVNGGNIYVATVAGVTHASSSGPSGTGTGIADNTVTWDYVSASVSGVIGPSIADQNNGLSFDPANVAFVLEWKSRLWLVERDTSRAWYGGVNAVAGAFTSFDFGSRMRAGGPLVGLWEWSYDGGSGIDSLLVGVSGAGDVVIYQGTDPSSVSTFGLKGSWSVGAIPSGRRIAIATGGGLSIVSLLGLVPLAKLVAGGFEASPEIYATAKVANDFGRIAAARKSLPGWALHIHPEENALMVMIPTTSGQPTEQYMLSLAKPGWWPYRSLPMLSAGAWNGQMYFGTVDGRVCVNTGYVDGVTLADPTSFTAVAWSICGPFVGDGRNVQVQMIRPQLHSETPSPRVEATARYDLNLVEPAAPSGNGGGGSGAWDSALWDSATWGPESGPSQPIGGTTGMGSNLAIAIRGNAISRTVLVGADVFLTTGGYL